MPNSTGKWWMEEEEGKKRRRRRRRRKSTDVVKKFPYGPYGHFRLINAIYFFL